MEAKRTIVIVGAGLGGLAAAARLAKRGFDVRVIEKEAGPGGRCSALDVEGFHWDIGPTILLFPDVLRQTFSDCGEDIRSFIELLPCHPNTRLHYRDGSTLTTSSNLREMQAELERFAPGSFDGFLRFLDLAREQKRIAFDTFLSRTFDKPWEMFSPAALRGVYESRSYRSLHAVVSELVEDPRLRIALTFQTMYLGLSPFQGPALFGLLPYTEYVDGVWYARGGLSSISEGLAALATKLGAKIEYGRAARSIETAPPSRGRSGRARAVVLEDGTRIAADVILANADLPYVLRSLLDRPIKRRLEYTSSAFMLFLGCNRSFERLIHHNAFFGHGYAESFGEIFDDKRIPHDPSFYVANPVRTDATVAPEGKSSLYVLVPVPHLDARGPDWRDPRVQEDVRRRVLDRLEATVAPGIEQSIVVERRMTPLDWQSRFSLERGSAFGLSHTLTQVAAFRPPNRDPEIENLYFVGASTQPATGIPNVLIGAKHVSARIEAESSGGRA